MVVSFNLLSEILFVQAARKLQHVAGGIMFQSLERDSVCSSNTPTPINSHCKEFQSLERDSVCSSVSRC